MNVTNKVFEALQKIPKIINRGTGAGGAATNLSGIAFESQTSIIPKLTELGYQTSLFDKTKNGYAMSKNYSTHSVLFMTQGGLSKLFIENKLFRHPDESFLIIEKSSGKKTLKIIEKKYQSVSGSVDLKLALGPYFIEEYQEVLGPEITIEYAFCLCNFLKTEYTSDVKKWKTMRTINERHGIKVFFGEDANYIDDVSSWVNL
jgi:hypothetical protein